MAKAGLVLFEVTGTPAYLERARAWTATLDQFFWDAAQGGYYQTASDGERLIARPRNASDNAVPSGNGTMVGVLARLYLAHRRRRLSRSRAPADRCVHARNRPQLLRADNVPQQRRPMDEARAGRHHRRPHRRRNQSLDHRGLRTGLAQPSAVGYCAGWSAAGEPPGGGETAKGRQGDGLYLHRRNLFTAGDGCRLQ